jgi:uncharacterized protein involved in tolerance to divalent cations
MTTAEDPEDLIGRLYHDTMVADEWDMVKSVKRNYLKNGQTQWADDRHHLTMITSDDRVAEAIEEVAAWSNRKDGMPFDLVVLPVATGSKEYIEWVKLQTLKKDGDTAFFNVAAEAEIKALTNRVGE